MGDPKNTVRLYGRVVGNGSHARVTAGFRESLRAAELLAGVVAFDRDLPPDSPQPGGALAPSAVFTGPLGYLQALRRGVHRHRYAMVAPNSSLVPPNLIGALEAFVTEVLVPSEWARGVLEEHTSLPVRTVPHGIDRAFASSDAARDAARAAYGRGGFDVLHLSTSERERKGTRPLVEAWAMLMERGELPSEARLRLVLDGEAASGMMGWMAERAAKGGVSNVVVVVRIDASPERLSKIYGEHHVLCQPSRGEGFGCCPVESLACGVPIVATTCTGHSQWFVPGLPGAIVVEHGPDAEIDDLPGALAPEVTADAIAAALREAYMAWPYLDTAALSGADDIRARWAWQTKLAPFVAHLKETTT